LARRKKEQFVTTGQASALLDGVVAPGVLRAMALAGEIHGSLLIRDRVYIPRRVVSGLVRELEFQPAARVLRPRAAHTTMDGELAG
jgi:hypothetical protein